MSEPKVIEEEMLKCLKEWFDLYRHELNCSEKYLLEILEHHKKIYAAIRIAIENMDKEVSREYVEKWTKEFSGFTENYDTKILLERMLYELGLEVEEKEVGDE